MRRHALALTAAVAASWLVHAGPAAASNPSECVTWDSDGYCVEWGTHDDDHNPGDGGGGGGGGNGPACFWVDRDPPDDPTVYVDFGLPYPPPGVAILWQEWVCTDGSPAFNLRWIFDIPPEDVARDVRVRIAGRLGDPEVAASPPIGTPSIIEVPVFVAISNWTGAITDSGCGGGICVTVTATPRLTFEPGEPGTGSIDCADSGTVFDPARPPKDQASAPGACSHTFATRTGVQGRPQEWPGSATVTWSISWTSTVGQSGTLPSIVRSTAVPRAVQEVQAIVVGGETP